MHKIFITVLIIVIAALAFVAGDRHGKDQTNTAGGKTERKILYYTDPMNPGFRSEKPGTAPCGMPLEPVYGEVGAYGEQVVTSGGPMQSPGAVTVNPARQQLIGVQVSPVEIRPMTHTLRLYGRIVPDEIRIYRTNASTDSWVRELSDITTGSIVGQDQLLAEVLAPAFYNAQVTYLVAMDNLDRIRKQLGGDVRHQQTELADNQIRMAVQNLQNLGITDAQIEELANTRKSRPYMQVRSPVDGVVLNRNITLYQWFKAGEEFYEIADLSRVWVYADVYEDEAMHLWPGMPVKVRHEQSGRAFEAKVSRVLPLFDAVAKTVKVRLDVDNPRYELRPDMFVDVEIPITMAPSLHVPSDAVIDSGTRKIIYVAADGNTFEPRIVETGWRLGRRTEITQGLMPGENIIISGNFLIDSESRMKTAAGGVIPAMSKDPVCGMLVNEEYARLTGKTVTNGDTTYYFCMDECRDSFTKEPEKYAQQVDSDAEADMTGDVHEHHDSIKTEDDKSWLEQLAPDKGSHRLQKSGTYPGQKMGRKIGTSEGSAGDVDWDGPDPQTPRDWSGWGKFPGAKYLGIHDDKKKTAAQHEDMEGMKKDSDNEEDPSASDAAAPPTLTPDHEVMKEDQHQYNATDQPMPPADK
jgi:Cu(I)/Ag(I) efflux system membrane fusion protein